MDSEVPVPSADDEEAEELPEFEMHLLASYREATDSGMVVDSGATRSCGSIAALERLQNHFLDISNGEFDGVTEFDDTQKVNFKFGNGATMESLGVAKIATTTNGQLGTIPVHVLDTGDRYVPLLAGLDWLEELEAELNFKRAVLHTTMGDIKLKRAGPGSTGHYVIDLKNDLVTGRAVLNYLSTHYSDDEESGNSAGSGSGGPQDE